MMSTMKRKLAAVAAATAGLLTVTPSAQALNGGGDLVNRDNAICVQVQSYYSSANRSAFICPGHAAYGDVNTVYIPFGKTVVFRLTTDGGVNRGTWAFNTTFYVADSQLIEILDVRPR